MTKYTVPTARGSCRGSFCQDIEDYLKKGRRLQGGISVSKDGQDVIYAQALTKEKDVIFTDEYYDDHDE